LGLLSGGPADLPARHRSLRATIEASLAVVTEDARTLFAWLGAFADGARLADLEAVVESLGSGRDWLRAALGELIDTSLVRVEDPEGASRCVMPDAMTELAREHLSARADRAAVQRAVAIRFLERVRRFEQDPQRDDRREAGNIRVAVQDAIAHDITLLDDDSLRALRTFHELNGLPKEGQRLQTAAGDAGVPIGYLHAGRIARLQGDLAEAARFGQLAMNRLDTTDTTVLTAVRMHLGAVATEAGDSAVARSHFRAVLVAARRSKDLGRIGNALNNLGALSAETGRLEDAERLFLAALEARYRSGASELLIGDCLHNLAEVALEMGRYGLAVKRAEQAAPQVSDRMISHAATIRALALVGLGRVAEAREAIRLVERWLGEAHEEGRYAALIGIRTSVVLAAAGETASAAQLLSAWVPVMLDSIPRYHDEVASMLEAHARILAPAKAATAARLLGAAHALRRRSSRLVSAALVSNAEAVAAVCRDALGDKGFELEHLAGTRLGADALAGLCAGL
jgi:tetratricopeptide (TPR) repeat protein